VPSGTEILTVPICVTRNNEDLSLHHLSSFVAKIEPDKRPPIPAHSQRLSPRPHFFSPDRIQVIGMKSGYELSSPLTS
jgi:hypothetical protein